MDDVHSRRSPPVRKLQQDLSDSKKWIRNTMCFQRDLIQDCLLSLEVHLFVMGSHDHVV